MEENFNYINDTINRYLTSEGLIKDHDIITINSLFRSCIESDNPELPKSSVIIRDFRNSDISHSFKLKNVKFKLRFAVDMIFGVHQIYSSENIWLLLIILKTILRFFSDFHVRIDERMTFILYSVHYLDYLDDGIDIERLIRHINENAPAELKGELSGYASVQMTLDDLEAMGCLALENGKYHLVETIIS